jgi:hypothetical protein
MNAPVTVADLFRVLLPRNSHNGWLTMLSAYFDDSGTHKSSKIALLGGITGTEWQLNSLELAWRKQPATAAMWSETSTQTLRNVKIELSKEWRRAGLSAWLPALRIRRGMDAIQGAVVSPQVAIVEPRAARRRVFWNRPPRASRAQNIHDPVHPFAHVDVAVVATALGRQEHRFDCVHSSSVTSLGYRNSRRSQRARFFAVAIVEPPRIKPPLLNHKRFKGSNMFSNRHSGTGSGRNFHTILHLHVIRKKYIHYINKLCHTQPYLKSLGPRSCGFDSRRPHQRFREAVMQGAGTRVSPAFKKKATRRVFAAP